MGEGNKKENKGREGISPSFSSGLGTISTFACIHSRSIGRRHGIRGGGKWHSLAEVHCRPDIWSSAILQHFVVCSMYRVTHQVVPKLSIQGWFSSYIGPE